MQAYIGTKIVQAEPMDSLTFSTQVRPLPDVVVNANGYKVVYDDGYVSWSPQSVFNRCYRPITFAEADLISRPSPVLQVRSE